MIWTLELLREQREEILNIAWKHGARNVKVFASVARCEADPESDSDFVIEFEPETSLMDHGELLLDLEEALVCHVDVVSACGMRQRMKTRVEADAVAL